MNGLVADYRNTGVCKHIAIRIDACMALLELASYSYVNRKTKIL